MADELKEVFRDVDVGEDEMRRYRAGLSQKLDQTQSHARPWLMWVAPAFAMLLLIGGAWLYQSMSQPGLSLPQQHPEALQALLDSTQDHQQLLTQSRELLTTGSPLEQKNARALITMLSMGEPAILSAAQALATENRTEFRVWYLELMLDQGDEWVYNLDLLEDMMDQETDPLCLDLYRHLLHLAV